MRHRDPMWPVLLMVAGLDSVLIYAGVLVMGVTR